MTNFLHERRSPLSQRRGRQQEEQGERTHQLFSNLSAKRAMVLRNAESSVWSGGVASAPKSLTRANSERLRAPSSFEATCSASYSSCVRRKMRLRLRGLVTAMLNSLQLLWVCREKSGWGE